MGTRSITRLFLGLVSLTMLTGCLGLGSPSSGSGGGGGTEVPSKVCEGDEFLKTYTPVRIDGGQHLTFSQEALKAISDPKFKIESVTLILELSARPSNSNVTVGFNGVVGSRDDRVNGFDDVTAETKPKASIRIHKMKLNGTMPILSFLSQISKNKGDLKISVQGKGVKIVSARMEVKGYLKEACPDPTPTPTPVIPAPKASISSVEPQAAVTSETSVRFAFESDQPGSSFVCSLDGAAEAACSSPALYSGLASGEHNFSVWAINAHGLKSQPATHSWSVDTVPPVVAISPVPGLINSSSLKITFTSADGVSFGCSLDGAEPKPCTSPVELSGLREGIHEFAVSSVDSVGNISTPASVNWRVDLTAPNAAIVDVQPSQSPSTSRVKTFTFASDESATFECSVDSGAFAVCSSPNELTQVSEGPHTFSVRAIDAAGNQGPAATSSWIVDLTAPVVNLGSIVPAPGTTNAREFSVEFAASEASTFLCSLDGGAEAECVSPWAPAIARDGAHRVAIVAVDLAGLRSQAVTVDWMVDTAAADIRLGSILPSAASSLSTDTVSVEVESDEPMSLMASLNGQSLGAVSSPIVLSNLQEGSYTLQVTGRDSAGNPSNVLEHGFAIDRTAPILQLVASVKTSPTNVTANSFELSSNEDATYECELDGAGFGACQSPAQVSGLIEGEHTFRARAKDAAGNFSEVEAVTWTVDVTAPVTTAQATQTGSNSFSVEFTADDAQAVFTCAVDSGPEASCTSPFKVSGLSVGSHAVIIRALDKAGNKDTAGTSVTVTAQQPIAVSLVSPQILYTNQRTITFNFSANHSNATFFCALDGGAAAACSSPHTYNNLSDREHTFQVWAVDRWGQASAIASYVWTVDTTSPVVITSSTSALSSSITVTWTTNELATSKLNWGTGTDSSRTTAESTTYETSHSVRLSGLAPNTLYTVQTAGRDRAGNAYAGAKIQVRTRF